jgi:hypothetical protein
MREYAPDLCWAVFGNMEQCCILDRGHDGGVHERTEEPAAQDALQEGWAAVEEEAPCCCAGAMCGGQSCDKWETLAPAVRALLLAVLEVTLDEVDGLIEAYDTSGLPYERIRDTLRRRIEALGR